MDRDEDYRQQAEAAQVNADQAKSDSDRASWLRIAQGWMSLVRNRKSSLAEKFDEQVKDQGTRQEDSTESH
jgi:hypothetical protein